MTETPSTTLGSERRRLDAVSVIATVLLGLLLGAVAWLLIIPGSSPDDVPAAPLVTLTLPPQPIQAGRVPTEPTIEPELTPVPPREPPVAVVETPPEPPPAAVRKSVV